MRIFHDFALCLIKKAEKLYTKDYFRLGLDDIVYAFDSTTIKVCPKLCSLAQFHHDKGAFKMHTLLNLRGNIPFFIYLTDVFTISNLLINCRLRLLLIILCIRDMSIPNAFICFFTNSIHSSLPEPRRT